MGFVHTVSSFVPPPTFLRMPTVGVDISDTTLKYVRLRSNHRRTRTLELVDWGNIDIPSGVLKGGVVEDQKQLTSVLQEFKKRTEATFVRLALPEERAYVFETDIKRGTPLKEIRGMLEFRLEENVPISPRDAIFDYEIIPTDLNNRAVRVVVVVYARETIIRYHDACRNAGLTPISFEVEAQAMARATIPAHDDGAHMIIDFGKTRTGIGITLGGHLMFTSTIDIGGDHLSSALRRQLGEDLAESELTKIKNSQGLLQGVDDSNVYDALISIVSVIKDEMALRLQYWNTRNFERGKRRVQSIVLCGGSSNMKGLPEYLTEALGVRTVRGNVWENVLDLDEVVPPIDRRHSYGYAAAIGLMLRDFI